MAAKHIVLPLKREGRTLTVAMADPSDLGLLDDLKFITRYDLFPVIAGEYTLRTLIERHYESAGNEQQLAEPPEGHGGAARTTSRSSRSRTTKPPPRRRSTTRRWSS